MIKTKKEIKSIRETFPRGTVIKLLRMGGEEKFPVPPGTKGIVTFVDDAGTVHMKWDSGGSLGLILGVDDFVILKRGG
ncbi:MAG: DUF4314 domain-containing protein [Ruminococcus sp.]|nr:DUF4314 domain-containing protein [Ruminococcus sp.]